MKKKISITIDEKILKNVDVFIDGIRIRNRSQAIEFLLTKIVEKRKTAVIMANGLHFRITNDYFRVLGKLNGRTVIEDIIEKLRRFDFKRIIMVGERNLLAEIFKLIGDGSTYGVDITYVNENGSIGTQERLRLLRGLVKTTFLLIPGDNVFEMDLGDFFQFHISNKGIATLGITTSSNPTKFGVIEMVGNRIVRFVQKPKKAESYLVSSGIMLAEPEILNYPGKWLEFDVFPKLSRLGLLYGYLFSFWIDVHTQEDLRKARVGRIK